MTSPHYINENKSDIRGIKPGWYAMDDAGKLSSGPFSNREECLSEALSQRANNHRGRFVHGRSEQISIDVRPGRRLRT